MRRFQLLYEMWHLACNFVTQLRAGQFVGLMFSRERNVVWKKCYMKCGVWNEMKIWSSHLLNNLSNSLMNLKKSGDSTGFEPMTSAMPVQCSNQLSYEITQLRADQFVGLMFSRERNVVWKKCYMKCGVWNEMKIWSSHLLDNFKQLSHEPEKFRWLKNSGDSTQSLSWLEHCSGIAEVMGSNPVESPEFFRFMRQLLKLSSKCEDHIFKRYCINSINRSTTIRAHPVGRKN